MAKERNNQIYIIYYTIHSLTTIISKSYAKYTNTHYLLGQHKERKLL
jgi:hypothetical protein